MLAAQPVAPLDVPPAARLVALPAALLVALPAALPVALPAVPPPRAALPVALPAALPVAPPPVALLDALLDARLDALPAVLPLPAAAAALPAVPAEMLRKKKNSKKVETVFVLSKMLPLSVVLKLSPMVNLMTLSCKC